MPSSYLAHQVHLQAAIFMASHMVRPSGFSQNAQSFGFARQPRPLGLHAWSDLKASAQSNHIQRKLSGLERFYLDIANYNDNETVSAYRVQLKGDMSSDDLLNAVIQQLPDRVPALAQAVKACGVQDFCFLPLGEGSLLQFEAIETEDPNHWQEVMKSNLKTKFNHEQEPLLRFYLVKNTQDQTKELFIIGHHSLVDGQGALSIMDAVFQSMNEYTAQKLDLQKLDLPKLGELDQAPMNPKINSLDLFVSAPKAVPAITEPERETIEYADHLLKQSKLTKPSVRFFAEAFLMDMIVKKLWPLFKTNQLTEGTQLIHSVLSKAETNEILMACKKNGVSIHGALSTAAILLSRNYFPKQSFGQLVTTLTPVSIRDRLEKKVTHETMGCFISSIRDFHWDIPQLDDQSLDDQKSTFWNFAKKCQNTSQSKLEQKEHEHMPWLLEQFFEANLAFESIQNAISPDTLILNNLGRQTLKGPNEEEIDTFSWSTYFNQLAPGASINFLTMNGHLNLSVFSRRLKQDQVDEYAAEIISLLKLMSQSAPELPKINFIENKSIEHKSIADKSIENKGV